MKELKGAIIFASGLAIGVLAGMVHGAAIQKTIDKKPVATKLNLV